LREADTVARIGGDECGLILIRTGAAGRVLDKIVAANAEPVAFEGRALAVSVSLGACAYPDDADTELQLREGADLRMCEAKRAGGNRYVL
jgi:diguanylate cyclase (GGDEF)-like protein